jgi:hypothetical protein
MDETIIDDIKTFAPKTDIPYDQIAGAAKFTISLKD